MSRRILLADDSVTIQKVIELTFMDDDYEVRAVGNGDEALAMLTALQVDFVIADVHMPGASGYEVCRRSKQVRPEVPVLLLVGTFEPFDEAQARAAGADSFLKKPFDSQELLGRVHDLLGGAAAPSHPPEGDAAATAAGVTAPPASPAAATPATVESAASGEHGVEAAATWQEFELEAEPELIPDPWEENLAATTAATAATGTTAAAAPAAAPTVPPHFEQPFALGDLDEPEPLEGHGMAAAAGFEPPAASAPPPPPPPPISRQVTPPPAGPGAGQGGEEPRPFTFGEPLDERSFLRGEPDEAAAGARHVDRPTVAEPVFSFAPPAPLASPGAAGRGATGEMAIPAVAPPPVLAVHAGAGTQPGGAPPASEERADAPLGPSPFTVGLQETEDGLGEPAAHPAFGSAAPAAPAALPPAAAEDNGKPPLGGGGASPLSDAEIERIARRVVELIGDKVVRDVAWEVIPDLAEVVIKDRLRELESQVE